jgi:peroxin-5
MDELFRASCADDGQNPLNAVLNSLLNSNPAEHRMNLLQDDFQDIWEESEARDFSHLDSEWQDQRPPDFQALWNDNQREPQDALDLAWNHEENDYKSDLNDFLQSWNQEQKKYNFEENNEFLGHENCFQSAVKKEELGLTNEAILLLEAEVMKNPQNSEAWCLLGRLHAKNDEDSRAISAMLRGLEVDPYNLELLMYLGISCTNEFDEDQALMYLKTWIQHHPIYSEIPVDQRQNLKEDILEAFKVAISMNPNDPDIFQATGVLSYLSSDFVMAEENFRMALSLKQDDAAIWNRLGASLAKQNRTEEAFACYHKALEIKPDFVRTWGNLGLAYSNLKDYENCARFYLCALSLNPNASHLYNYLTTAFIMMNRADLLEKLSLRDISLFQQDFDIITRDSLPKGAAWAEEFIN